MATPHTNLEETLNTTTMPTAPIARSTTTTTTSSTQSQKYTYYHAGPLFTIADLSTNVTLSGLIHSISSSKFTPILPQDLEARSTHPHHIRDQDIRALLSCDLALFTYDGAELDAGTVVEYMVAKMADIPAVILRTDIRGGGDQGVGSGSGGDAGGAGLVSQEGMGDSWNLMSSFWPRTRCVVVDSMVGYKRGLQRALAEGADGKGNVRAGQAVIEETARMCVSALEEVVGREVRLRKDLREGVYEWLALMPGLREGTDEENIKEMKDVLKGKVERGLL